MTSRKCKPANPVKPGRWLGFFFWGIFVCGLLVIGIEVLSKFAAIGREKAFFAFSRNDWLIFLGGWSTILAAITTARITINNARKQHTITVLLQMRLSELYMEAARKVRVRYFPVDGIQYIRREQLENRTNGDAIDDLLYVLNYLKFVASAIRYGDLDESLMKESLRGIVCNNYDLSSELITYRRNAGGVYNPPSCLSTLNG